MYYPPGFSKDSYWDLLLFLIFSFIFHGVVLFVIPNFLAVKHIEIIPVTYMKPLTVRLKNLPPFPARTTAAKKGRKPVEKKESQRFVKKKIQALSLGKGLFLPPPSIQLPQTEFFNQHDKIEELYVSKKENRERLGTSTMPMGVPSLLPNVSYESPALSSPKADRNFTEGLVRELKREIRTASKKTVKPVKSGKTTKKRISNIRLGVEGPVSERRVLYRPPLPSVSTEQTVQIKLKFWVAPNGIVDQIVPVERGGIQLETIAIDFLKKWRFEPLPSKVKQERQWGILTVRFIIR